MYYPRFTKVIVNFFVTKDQSIPKRNRINWHYAKDDHMFTTIKVVSRHKDTQLYGAMLPNELTNEAIRDSKSYKEYYDIASGAKPPKTKASVKKKRVGSAKDKTKQAPKASSGAHEGTGVSPGVPDVPTYGSDDEQISWKSSDEEDDDDEENVSNDEDDDDQDNDDDQGDDDEQTDSDNYGDDFVHPKFSTHDEKDKEEDSFDLRVHTPSHVESTDDEQSDEEIQGANIEGEEMDEEQTNEYDKANELYKDVNINLEGRDSEMTDALRTMKRTKQMNYIGTFDHILKALEDNFLEFKQTNQFAEAISTISGIVDAYLANKMHEAVKTVVELQSDRLRDEAQAENADFINKLDDNIKKIIKDQVKEQVKAQISKMLPKIEKTVNEQLEAEVLTRSSNESKTSHAIATNLSELELKKILIDKMERNKSIHRSDEQKNLYKALVDAYESEKLILDKYGDTRKRARKEPESTSAPKEKTSKSTGKSKEGSKPHQEHSSKSTQADEPMHADKEMEEPTHQEFDTGFTEEQPVDEITQHPDWFMKPSKPTTPDRDWNKILPAQYGPVQP
ncbi:hypothetical protein Tco_0984453 [Tanacetum coccineum]